jgi:hypothetical protein
VTNDFARLLAYYDGTGVDSRGRTIEQVLAFPFATMEASHDVTPDAPLAGPDCQRFFAEDPTRAIRLRRAFERMLDFYGLLLVHAEAPQVVKGPHFHERAAIWLTPGNHNFLRLTRILKSLTLLGAGELAAALFWCLEAIYAGDSSTIGETTFGYWRRAASNSG